MNWIYLGTAIIAEVVATSALKATDGFKNLLPSAVSIIGYSIAFYALSLALKSIPVGIAYAIWAGMGIVLIALIGWIYYKQPLDTPAVFGIVLIMSGIIVMNLFSKSIGH